MADELKKMYRDVEIAYVEHEDRWNFTVNGCERNADSLTKAKESIDRALDHERKERPWKPFPAYFKSSYSNAEFKQVTVTSQAARGYGSSVEFWISSPKKNGLGGETKRSKESLEYLYAVTPENDAHIAEWKELQDEIERLEAKARAVLGSIEHISVPTPSV